MGCDYTTSYTFWHSFLLRQYLFILCLTLPRFSSDKYPFDFSWLLFGQIIHIGIFSSKHFCFSNVFFPESTFFKILMDFFHPWCWCLPILQEDQDLVCYPFWSHSSKVFVEDHFVFYMLCSRFSYIFQTTLGLVSNNVNSFSDIFLCPRIFRDVFLRIVYAVFRKHSGLTTAL